MAKWLIDAGHGGSDSGACYNGRKECDDVLNLALKVGEVLQQNGENVFYTRKTNSTMSLTQRSNMENSGSYDFFISIHRNAVGPEIAKGVETFIFNGSYASKEVCRSLATKVNNNLVNIGFVNRGVKEENLHVLRETKCPSILVEVGFIDNSSDNTIFDSKFNEIVNAIANGCLAQVNKSINKQPVQNNVVSNNKQMFRVRKSWNNVSSQIGAFTNLDSAKKLCDKNAGYFVFDTSGNVIYPMVQNSCDKELQRYTEYGKCTITTQSGIIFRDKPCTCHGSKIGTYEYKESVNYDLVVITEKYVWISWIGGTTKTRRYMPIKDKSTGEKWGNCI